MFAEADYEMTQQALSKGDNTGRNDVSQLYVRFYMHPREDQTATAKEGRPIFAEIPYLEIHTPGDKTTIIKRPVRDKDKHDFPKLWDMFQTGAEEAVQGTPLEQWPQVTRSQVEEMRFFKIRTVEQLAGMADVHIQKFMGLVTIRQKARDWLSAAENSAPIVALREDNEALKLQIKEMQANLTALLEDKNKPTKAPVGRPRNK